MTQFPPAIKERLARLENALQAAVSSGATDKAIEIAGEIQGIFGADLSHHRLLKAKLWVFEAALDANKLNYAESGFSGIRQRANPDTRIYLEATSLLAICLLRKKEFTNAKELIRDVIQNINNIRSDRTRHKFQKALIERIEQECILTELIGQGEGRLKEADVQAKAVQLIQQNSHDDIIKLIGNSVPAAGIQLLRDVREYSILQISIPDQKMLPSPQEAEKPANLGKKTLTVLQRIAWKALCQPDSEIYKLWSQKVPKVFNEGWFTASMITSFHNWQITIPLLASGFVAMVMKYSAQEFCEFAKPKGLMSVSKDKRSKAKK